MTDAEKRAAYPGVLEAYDFVMPSYQWMLARFEAADNRINTLHVFIATITLAIPAGVKSVNPLIRFADWRFVFAALVFIVVMGLGLRERLRGGVVLANPRVHQEQWLRFSEWEFQKNAVFWAAEHFRLNSLEIQRKTCVTALMIGLFVVEVLLLLGWFAAGSVSAGS